MFGHNFLSKILKKAVGMVKYGYGGRRERLTDNHSRAKNVLTVMTSAPPGAAAKRLEAGALRDAFRGFNTMGKEVCEKNFNFAS